MLLFVNEQNYTLINDNFYDLEDSNIPKWSKALDDFKRVGITTYDDAFEVLMNNYEKTIALDKKNLADSVNVARKARNVFYTHHGLTVKAIEFYEKEMA